MSAYSTQRPFSGVAGIGRWGREGAAAQHPHAGPLQLLHIARHGGDSFAAQAVEGPDEEHVELPPVRTHEDSGECRPVAPRAARGVGVDPNHDQPETGGPAAELELLGSVVWSFVLTRV